MSLRDDLKAYIPKYLWEVLNHPQGYIVGAEEFNARWNLIRTQGDHVALTIEEILDMLYATVLHDTEGAIHMFTSIPGISATNVRDAIIEFRNAMLGEIVRLDSDIDTYVSALTTHRTSSDHDGRYNTKAEVASMFTTRDNALNTHKGSSDHDGRYYTETETDTLLGLRDTALTTHKASNDHDARYNTKEEVIDLVSVKADWESIYTDSELSSTTAEDTGAHLIGANVGGVIGVNVHEVLLSLRDRINDAAEALIVDGSVTDIKLSDEPTAIKARVAQLELDYPELFLSVNSGKNALETAVVDMRGTVSQAGDYPTFAELDAGIRSIPQGKGNALVADVLAPKTFTNNDGVEYIGTMPSKAAATITPSGMQQTIAAGQYLAGVQTIDSLGGDAAAGNVLAGKSFSSNVAGRAVAGTMVNRAGTNASLANSAVATTITVRPPAGYYDGVDDVVTAVDADFIAANLKTGVNFYGLAGTFTSDANSLASDILSGKTSYVNGVKVTGTIPSKGAQTYTPGATAQTIAAGQYLSGIQTIAGVNLRKFAEGTVTSNGVIEQFTRADGGTVGRYSVTVSGLTFTPKIIYVAQVASAGWYLDSSTTYTADYAQSTTSPNAKINHSQNVYVDVTPAYINGTGFKLPVSLGNYSHKWIAFG